jgi:endonuclease-3 related protein
LNPSRPDLLLALYDRLLQTLGPQYWWPADTAFEVVVGAILTQNTAWRNVKLSIALLKENGLLSQEPLRVIPEAELALIIRSSGY